MPKINIDKVYL
jgi:hypothetical protein